jgi:hypothetical protein
VLEKVSVAEILRAIHLAARSMGDTTTDIPLFNDSATCESVPMTTYIHYSLPIAVSGPTHTQYAVSKEAEVRAKWRGGNCTKHHLDNSRPFYDYSNISFKWPFIGFLADII